LTNRNSAPARKGRMSSSYVRGELNKHSGEASSRAGYHTAGRAAKNDRGRTRHRKAGSTGPVQWPAACARLGSRPRTGHTGNVAARLRGRGMRLPRSFSGSMLPRGRLSVTIPSVTGQCPRYYNHPEHRPSRQQEQIHFPLPGCACGKHCIPSASG
jgi:hypothetical protein